MTRRRFYVDEVRRGEAELSGDEAEHLTRVLRAEPGQQYEICDGARLFLSEIVEARKGSVRFHVLEELGVPERGAPLVLLMSLIKFERFEWAIEKATELGVDMILPVAAERSEKGLEKAARKRVERWRKIARAAGQQSRRVHLPDIPPNLDFSDAAQYTADRRFYLEENPGCQLLLQASSEQRSVESTAIFVGPEGGWTDGERSLLLDRGWEPVSLGPTILRAETAAIAALAILSQARLIK